MTPQNTSDFRKRLKNIGTNSLNKIKINLPQFEKVDNNNNKGGSLQNSQRGNISDSNSTIMNTIQNDKHINTIINTNINNISNINGNINNNISNNNINININNNNNNISIKKHFNTNLNIYNNSSKLFGNKRIDKNKLVNMNRAEKSIESYGKTDKTYNNIIDKNNINNNNYSINSSMRDKSFLFFLKIEKKNEVIRVNDNMVYKYKKIL